MGVYDETVFDVLDASISESKTVIKVSDYDVEEGNSYDWFSSMEAEGLLAEIREGQYVITNTGLSYHSTALEDRVLSTLYEEGTSSVSELTRSLGYERCNHHAPRHVCPFNAVQRSLRGLIGDGRVASTAEWNYKLSSQEREEQANIQ